MARDPEGGDRRGTADRLVEEGPGVGEILPGETLDELRATARPNAVADAARALADAVVALSEDGDPEAAVRAARAAKRAAPRSASVREALGIALYQMGDFRSARTELAAAQRISGRQDLAAMLADIERALGRPERAIALFERVDRSKMDADTAAELLLVAASAYGDLDRPAAGVALIRRHARWPAALADHHLRLAYAEGALAEQAGDLPHAQAAFSRVFQADPGFHDTADRLERLDSSGFSPCRRHIEKNVHAAEHRHHSQLLRELPKPEPIRRRGDRRRRVRLHQPAGRPHLPHNLVREVLPHR